ncbi:MAG: CPBP family intramembrane glutamic endopeptidase [Clostridia bacterium]
MVRNNKTDVLHIATISIASCIIFYISTQFLKLDYVLTSGVKIFGFLVIPIIYSLITKNMKDVKNIFTFKDLKSIKYGISLGIISCFTIIGLYGISRNFFDFSMVKPALMQNSFLSTGGADINLRNYILGCAYIICCNSFLEEVFFRGMIFLNIYNKGYKKFAYIFSALLFATYHIAIFQSWFPLPLMIVIFIGLILGGLLFEYLNVKSKNMYNSWIVHALTNVGINLVGLYIITR